jgi:hypothetical protein
MKRDVAALIAFINSRRDRPHKWGSRSNDCASFANGAVKATTGEGALGGLHWSGKIGALRALKSVGGIEAALDARFERIAPAEAHRGDIAAIPAETMAGLGEDEIEALGLHPMIVEGPTLVSPGERGLRRCKRSLAVAAWDVTRRK